MLDQAPGSANEDFRVLAHLGGLNLEVFTTGDQLRLDESIATQCFHLLEGLLGQLTGGQQNQGTGIGTRPGMLQQLVQHGQHEGGGLAATGAGHHTQVVAGQCLGDG